MRKKRQEQAKRHKNKQKERKATKKKGGKKNGIQNEFCRSSLFVKRCQTNERTSYVA